MVLSWLLPTQLTFQVVGEFFFFLGVKAAYWSFIALVLLWIILQLWLRFVCKGSWSEAKKLVGKETVGFFHPYCVAGGGGERVLWCALNSVQKHHPELHSIVYTGDKKINPTAEWTKPEIIERVKDQFGIVLQEDSVDFVHMNKRSWIEDWERFTLLGQSVGSMLLGWEALCWYCPDIMIDTMGYAFTYPVFRLLGFCRLGCYVHYPFVSTDMLRRVQKREVGVCNSGEVANSLMRSQAKLFYYRVIAVLYGMVGRWAKVVMVNSKWTRAHIDYLWNIKSRTFVVYPPCDTSVLASYPLQRQKLKGKFNRGYLVFSLAQYRPEKDQEKQMHAFATFLRQHPERSVKGGDTHQRVRFIMAGGCRDWRDWQRFRSLESLSERLGLKRWDMKQPTDDEDWDVKVINNLPLEKVQEYLGIAAVGLHTMQEEHFGISIVEFMAAGAVVLAHNSGGPKEDIVDPKSAGTAIGLLATDTDEYATMLGKIFDMSDDDRLSIAEAARKSVKDRFSQETFEDLFSSRMIGALKRKR